MIEYTVTPAEAQKLLKAFDNAFDTFKVKGEEEPEGFVTPEIGNRYLGRMEVMPETVRTYMRRMVPANLRHLVAARRATDGMAEYNLLTPYTDPKGFRNSIFRYGGPSHSQLIFLGETPEGYGPVAGGSDAVQLTLEHIVYETSA